MKTCKHCGGELVQPDVERNGQKHFNPYTCISALKARAERERDQLRAELDAARAAQEWRPVTEPPTDNGDCLVWSSRLGTDIACWCDGQFHYDYTMPPTHWRPLPAAPGDSREEAGA